MLCPPLGNFLRTPLCGVIDQRIDENNIFTWGKTEKRQRGSGTIKNKIVIISKS